MQFPLGPLQLMTFGAAGLLVNRSSPGARSVRERMVAGVRGTRSKDPTRGSWPDY